MRPLANFFCCVSRLVDRIVDVEARLFVDTQLWRRRRRAYCRVTRLVGGCSSKWRVAAFERPFGEKMDACFSPKIFVLLSVGPKLKIQASTAPMQIFARFFQCALNLRPAQVCSIWPRDRDRNRAVPIFGLNFCLREAAARRRFTCLMSCSLIRSPLACRSSVMRVYSTIWPRNTLATMQKSPSTTAIGSKRVYDLEIDEPKCAIVFSSSFVLVSLD